MKFSLLRAIPLYLMPALVWAGDPEVRISHVAARPGAGISLTAEVTPNTRITIEESSDLKNWHAATTREASVTPLVVDLPENSARAAFYRVTQGDPLPYVAGEVLLRFREGVSASAMVDSKDAISLIILEKLETASMEAFGMSPLLRAAVSLPVTEAVARLNADPAVEFAEPNYLVRAVGSPDDPGFNEGYLWGLYGPNTTPASPFGANAPAAWATTTGTTSVYVGIIDEGIQIMHEDLQANIFVNPGEVPGNEIDDDQNGYIDDVNGWDFCFNDGTVFDGTPEQPAIDRHGTHIAGTIGAAGNNGLGVVGINWQIRMIPAKFLGPVSGNNKDAIKAIDYLIDLKTRRGVNIVAINASWASDEYDQAVHEAIIRAAKAEILFVAGAANDKIDIDSQARYPACLDTTIAPPGVTPADYDAVITVAAIDQTGQLAIFRGGQGSNFGNKSVDLAAPGADIVSTVPWVDYDLLSGTSMATPHVTGAICLYASRFPTARAKDIKSAILSSAVPTASLVGKVSTGGRLDIAAALTIQPPPPENPLKAPTNLRATVNDKAQRVDLSWQDQSDNETGFRVERSPDGSTFEPIGASGAERASYRDNTVEANRTYFYRVNAFNSGGESDYSNTVEARVGDPILSPPSEVDARITSSGAVRVAWRDNSRNETGFVVQRSDDGVSFQLLTTAPANPDAAARIVDGSVVVGRTYFYRVQAVRDQVKSAYSDPVAITVIGGPVSVPRPVAPPSGASEVSRNPRLVWSGIQAATQYRIELQVWRPEARAWELVEHRSASSATTEYVVDGDPLRAHRHYRWHVKAFQSGNSLGGWSEWSEFTTTTEPLGAPNPTSPTCGSSNVERNPTLTWTPVQEAERYRVQVAVDDADSANIVEHRSGVTAGASFPIGGDPLRANRNYFWRVRAEADGPSEGPWSDWCAFKTRVVVLGQPTPLGPPCESKNVERNPTLTWTAVPDAEQYEVQVAVDKADPANVIEHRSGVSAGASFLIGGDPLRANRDYFWRVRAQAEGLADGPWSDWCAFKTVAVVLGRPTPLSPECGRTGVEWNPTLTWTEVADAAQYRVEVAVDAADPVNVIDHRSGVSLVPRFPIGGDPLRSNRNYFWRVRAEADGLADGEWSDWCSFKTN